MKKFIAIVCISIALSACSVGRASLRNAESQCSEQYSLNALRNNPLVKLSSHYRLAPNFAVEIETKYPNLRARREWVSAKLQLKEGDEMYFVEQNDPAAHFYEARFQFFRLDCTVSYIQMAIS